MTLREIRYLIDQVEFRDWKVRVLAEDGDEDAAYHAPLWLEVSFEAPDSYTGKTAIQRGRRWQLTETMTTTQILSTAWNAVKAAVEHEAREDFLWGGRPIFGPHIDAEKLWTIAEAID